MKTVATTEKSLITLTPETLATLGKMDAIAAEGRLAMAEASNSFHRAFLLADAMNQLRSMLTPEMMKPIMTLQCSALGFKTDKDTNGGYPVEVVKDCVIEAAMIGIYVVNNEMNIIAGRCYAAKNGLARLVKNFPGLTDLVMTPGIPVNKEGGTLVPYSATFKFEGKDQKLERTIPIRVNSGAIVDATMGKAKRKMYAAILEHLTGSEITEGETGDEPLGATVTAPAAAKRAPLPTDTKPAKVTSETTVPQPAGTPETPASSAATPPPLPKEGDDVPPIDVEIAEHDRLMQLIREDQEKNGWSETEMLEVLKNGYGFPKHSSTVKGLDDCTNKFLKMVVDALAPLNKAIEKLRAP